MYKEEETGTGGRVTSGARKSMEGDIGPAVITLLLLRDMPLFDAGPSLVKDICHWKCREEILHGDKEGC